MSHPHWIRTSSIQSPATVLTGPSVAQGGKLHFVPFLNGKIHFHEKGFSKWESITIFSDFFFFSYTPQGINTGNWANKWGRCQEPCEYLSIAFQLLLAAHSSLRPAGYFHLVQSNFMILRQIFLNTCSFLSPFYVLPLRNSLQHVLCAQVNILELKWQSTSHIPCQLEGSIFFKKWENWNSPLTLLTGNCLHKIKLGSSIPTSEAEQKDDDWFRRANLQ